MAVFTFRSVFKSVLCCVDLKRRKGNSLSRVVWCLHQGQGPSEKDALQPREAAWSAWPSIHAAGAQDHCHCIIRWALEPKWAEGRGFWLLPCLLISSQRYPYSAWFKLDLDQVPTFWGMLLYRQCLAGPPLSLPLSNWPSSLLIVGSWEVDEIGSEYPMFCALPSMWFLLYSVSGLPFESNFKSGARKVLHLRVGSLYAEISHSCALGS